MPPAPSAVATFIAAGTGLDPVAVQVWMNCEGGPGDNPLNIGPGAHPGVQGTINEINGGTNWGGIRGSRGQGAASQLAAIQASPWDAGHYSNGCLQRVLGEPLAAAPGPSQPTGAGGGVSFAGLVDKSVLDVLNPGGTDAFATSVNAWLVEHAIRAAELVGGGLLAALGILVLIDIASIPGSGEGSGLVARGARAAKRLTEQIVVLAA